MGKFINQVIGEEYKLWAKGNLILINSGTGTGKSTFVKNTLNTYCIENNKKILYLTNRDTLKEQIKEELNKLDNTNITVLNYQKIEAMLLYHVKLDNFDYVVMDEAHYFFTDSAFNIKTDLFFKKMLNDNTICKIMMTATSRILELYMKNHNIKIDYKYQLKTNYNYIKSITMFNTYESIDSIIEGIPKDEQILLFSSAKRALEISKKYNGAFICSKHNKDNYFKKYVIGTDNELERKNIIENSEFKNHLLCCTTAMDNGINIREGTPVKHIIIDILDRDLFIQCLGRKRVAEGENINLYFYGYKDNRKINGFKKKISNSIDRADYLKENGQEEYVKHKFKNEKFTDTRIIDDVLDGNGNINKTINDCMYAKYHADLCTYNSILSKKSKITYKSIIANALRISKNNIIELEVNIERLSLEETLESIVGKKLYKKERKELIEFIDLKQNGKQLKSPASFNASFHEQNIPFLIDKPPKLKSYRDKNGKVKKEKSYWMVLKIVGNDL